MQSAISSLVDSAQALASGRRRAKAIDASNARPTVSLATKWRETAWATCATLGSSNTRG